MGLHPYGQEKLIRDTTRAVQVASRTIFSLTSTGQPPVLEYHLSKVPRWLSIAGSVIYSYIDTYVS